MKSTFKKIISSLLMAVILVGMLPATAMAQTFKLSTDSPFYQWSNEKWKDLPEKVYVNRYVSAAVAATPEALKKLSHQLFVNPTTNRVIAIDTMSEDTYDCYTVPSGYYKMTVIAYHDQYYMAYECKPAEPWYAPTQFRILEPLKKISTTQNFFSIPDKFTLSESLKSAKMKYFRCSTMNQKYSGTQIYEKVKVSIKIIPRDQGSFGTPVVLNPGFRKIDTGYTPSSSR